MNQNPFIKTAFALETNIENQIKRSGFFKFDSLGQFITNLVDVAISLGAVITIVYLIWGGLNFILSGGDTERNKTSKNMISNSLIGLAILAVSWTIWRLVAYFLGLIDSPQGVFSVKLPRP